MRKYIPPDFVPVPKEAKCAFRGEIFSVYQWPQELFDGSVATFESLKRDDTVNVVAVKDDRIILTRQRQPRQDWYYAFPGGRNDHGDEDELTAAQREMLEETGMTFRNWRLIAARQPYRKIDCVAYTFLATGFENQVEQNLDPGEQIEVMEVSFDELLEIAKLPNAEYLKLDKIGDPKSLADLLSFPALDA